MGDRQGWRTENKEKEAARGSREKKTGEKEREMPWASQPISRQTDRQTVLEENSESMTYRMKGQ